MMGGAWEKIGGDICLDEDQEGELIFFQTLKGVIIFMLTGKHC